MTHKKNNSGIWIVVWMVALVGIAYLVSPQWREIFARNNNTSTQIGASCWTSKWCGGWCWWGTKTRVSTSSCGAGWGCGLGWEWCGGGSRTTATTQTTTNTVDTTSTYETMNVWHDTYSLVPETVNLTAGKNYKLVITPTADGGGCMNNMTLPGLDNNVYPVKKWVPVTIIINNAKAGTYELVCGNMWMYQWTIKIQ